MEIVKELSSISWLVDEPTYRADPALSQSTLGTYEKLGYNGLDRLFDRKETPSLTFGSATDALITGGQEEFDANFIVMDISITDSGIEICKRLADMTLPFESFDEIPEFIVSNTAQEVGFWKDSKWDKKRYGEVLKTGNVADYYKALRHSNKKILDTQTYQDVLACVRALKEAPGTAGYFAEDDPLSPIRRYYQLKFKHCHDNVWYRGMMDLLVVDYDRKIIYPYDLKTSSGYEWDFPEHFIQWGYNWQARLYWRLIRANLDKDPYFKDFELKNFKFIVVNRKTLTPLVWEFPLTQYVGTLVDDKGNEYRDPYEIGRELQEYLNCKPPVPKGINIDGTNTINCLHKKQ